MLRSMLDYLLDKTDKMASTVTAARARVAFGSSTYFNPWGGPMNGQTARLEATRQIIFRCDIQQIVETGTYRGVTTEWFAGFGLPVTTIESSESSYEFAKLRLRSRSNVRVHLGNSAEVLAALAATMDKTAPTLFYLDAHWESYLPLADELRIILPQFPSSVIVIDDFQVAGDSGYGYDDYGGDKALTAAYLEQCVGSEVAKYYPSTPAIQETGRRRGCVVLTASSQMIAALSGIDLLRREPHESELSNKFTERFSEASVGSNS